MHACGSVNYTIIGYFNIQTLINRLYIHINLYMYIVTKKKNIYMCVYYYTHWSTKLIDQTYGYERKEEKKRNVPRPSRNIKKKLEGHDGRIFIYV